jgi:hypothetical protein
MTGEGPGIWSYDLCLPFIPDPKKLKMEECSGAV